MLGVGVFKVSDLADIANDLIEQRLTDSLASRHHVQTRSNFYCDGCGDDIPEQRRAIGSVTHCIECQNLIESKQKHFRGWSVWTQDKKVNWNARCA